MTPNFAKAMALIDAAHAQDPNQVPVKADLDQSSSTGSSTADPNAKPHPNPEEEPTSTIAYELHYAHKMTSYLHQHTPQPSPLLSLAVRAQHLRRWEIPRSSYPDGRAGYFAWRTFLKKRQGELARDLCLDAGFDSPDAERVGSLIAKEGLKRGGGGGGDGMGRDDDDEEEVQILEDVACLVFLDDQFDEFERGIQDEEKILRILRKTWAKMGGRGRELALEMEMSGRARRLVEMALAGG